MIKVMLILWYLLVGFVWICGLIINLSGEFQYNALNHKKKISIWSIVTSLFLTVLFLIIALLPNFIVAVIQWIVSLFH